MVAQTLEDIIITDKEISGYMETRDTCEHLKIKKPSQYFEDVKKHFREDLTGGLSLPFINTEKDFKNAKGNPAKQKYIRERINAQKKQGKSRASKPIPGAKK